MEPNKIGLPGLIKTPLKKLDRLNFLTTEGTKSCFPAETAPDVIMIYILEYIFVYFFCQKYFHLYLLKFHHV